MNLFPKRNCQRSSLEASQSLIKRRPPSQHALLTWYCWCTFPRFLSPIFCLLEHLLIISDNHLASSTKSLNHQPRSRSRSHLAPVPWTSHDRLQYFLFFSFPLLLCLLLTFWGCGFFWGNLPIYSGLQSHIWQMKRHYIISCPDTITPESNV